MWPPECACYNWVTPWFLVWSGPVKLSAHLLCFSAVALASGDPQAALIKKMNWQSNVSLMKNQSLCNVYAKIPLKVSLSVNIEGHCVKRYPRPVLRSGGWPHDLHHGVGCLGLQWKFGTTVIESFQGNLHPASKYKSYSVAQSFSQCGSQNTSINISVSLR